MLEGETEILSPMVQTNQNSDDMKVNIKSIQQNLIMMGFDIIMINKIISIFKIRTEEEAIDYLIKSENGMWNHPFIPKEEETEEELLGQSRASINNVFTKINSIKKTMTFTKNNANLLDDNVDNDNNDANKNKEIKELKEDICEICGESKQFHSIKEFNSNNNNIIEDDIFEDNLIKKEDITKEKDDDSFNILKEDEKDEDINQNECQICMDELYDPVTIERCKHKFCYECFHSYLINLITNNKIDNIPCPKNKCRNINISEDFFSKYLTEQEYFKYRQFKAQNEIARDSKKVFCPLCDSYAKIEDGSLKIIDSNNPNYIKSTLICQNGHEFCTCGRPVHGGNCYHDEKEFQKFIDKENIKKCPKCGFLIKKNKGCNHMTCGNPTCKYEFCWICMQETVPHHYEYGPCAGKQFVDTESIIYGHPCLETLVNVLLIILFIILCIIGIAVPAISYSILFYIMIFSDEEPEDELFDFSEFKTSVKVIMYLGYVCLSIGLGTIVYISLGICLGLFGLAVGIAALIGIFDILHIIINCLCCSDFDGYEGCDRSCLIRIIKDICDC